ncbi:CapA family protein [Branchiibius hedensis]|nr:CapA family protein [Branchiibius hedensis]
MAGGDIFTNEGLIAQAKADGGSNGYDFMPQLIGLKPLVTKGDVAICQLETPLTQTNTNLGHGIVHNSPHQLAPAIKATGYDGCSFSNNHTFDNGLTGMVQTRAIMGANGLQLAGPQDSSDGKPGQPAWYDADGFKIAQLSYSYTLDNFAEGSQTGTPAAAPFLKKNLFSVIGAQGIIADAKAARAAGADIVVVSMHWGTQFKFTPDADDIALAQQIGQSGAVNWIIGNHPHVVQGCDKIGAMFVNYGLGNELSDQGTQFGYPVQTQDGIGVVVTFERAADGTITATKERYQPTWVDRLHGYRAYVVPESGAPAAVDPGSWARTSKLITSRGNGCNLSAIS